MPNGQPLGVEQWGKSTSTGEYVTHTFPIKFTVIPIVVAGALTSNTSGNTGSQSNPCYRSITVSNFVFCMYDNARGYAGSTYIAIGYQLQWGFTADSMSILFPMAFSSTSYILLSDIQVTSGGNILAAYIYQNTKTISGANFAYSYRRNWIAIGC